MNANERESEPGKWNRQDRQERQEEQGSEPGVEPQVNASKRNPDKEPLMNADAEGTEPQMGKDAEDESVPIGANRWITSERGNRK